MSEIIMKELAAACEAHDEWAALKPQIDNLDIGLHLAIMQQPYLGHVIEGGKTLESRFSMHNIPPFGKIAVGDLVLMKSGPVVGAFTATSTEFTRLGAGDIDKIYAKHSKAICAPDEFWYTQVGKRFATIIGIGSVIVLPPVNVTKRDMRGWVVLRARGDAVLF